LAVKIVRQVKSIALLGAPTSAAALSAGHERGPAALRAAGLVTRLTEAGFQVTDYGDCAPRLFQPDDEHPRARNVSQLLAILEELRPKVELAVKSGALPVVLGGDDSIALATIAGAKRYFRNVSLISMDRDAGLNVPATTPSGCVDGMVISHVIGRGAPELVRFWGEPPLVREPDVAVFGIERLDEPEQQFLIRSPLRRYLADDVQRVGPAAAAQEALERVHGARHGFVLHLDLDVIAKEEFGATNLSASGGLSLDQVRQALAVFARQPTLAALDLSAYNPALDPEGTAAKQVIDLLVEVLSARLESQPASEAVLPASGQPPAPVESQESAAGAKTEPAAPVTASVAANVAGDSAEPLHSAETTSEETSATGPAASEADNSVE
jgi:arginase